MEKTSLRPIVILGTPRSFTSLTAGIFRDHGVWFGKCREYTEFAPTGSCENARMKRILKSELGAGLVLRGELAHSFEEWDEKILAVMKDEGYLDGPLGFKHSAVYWPVWENFDVRFICCRRPQSSVVQSGQRTGMVAANAESWEKHQEIMDSLVETGKAVNVYGEKYFEGDWTDLKKAFEFCDLEFDQKIAENLLDHKHKHF